MPFRIRPVGAVRGWPLIFSLSVAAGLAPLSIDMYLPSFPALREEFGATAAQVQLTLSGFILGFALGQLCYGPLSDRFGRRPVLLSGICLYVGMTILCAVSGDIEIFTLFRFLQAVGGGAGAVLSRAIVRDRYSGAEMARVMSLMLTVILFAPMVAPVVGGYLLVWVGWRAVFWVLAVIGLAAIPIVAFGIEETLPRDRRSAPGVTSLLRGYGAVLGHRKALGYILSGGLSFAALFAFLSGAAFVFIEHYGLAPQHMGYVFTFNVVGVMIGGWINSRLVMRRGVREMTLVGAALLFAGALALFVLVAFDIAGMWGAIAGIFAFTLPLNMINANSVAGALEHFPRHAGTASAVVGAARYGFGALAGICVGLLHDDTAVPMVAVIFACSAASAIFAVAMVRR